MAFRSPGVFVPCEQEVVAQLLRQLKKFFVGVVSVFSVTGALFPQELGAGAMRPLHRPIASVPDKQLFLLGIHLVCPSVA